MFSSSFIRSTMTELKKRKARLDALKKDCAEEQEKIDYLNEIVDKFPVPEEAEADQVTDAGEEGATERAPIDSPFDNDDEGKAA